MNGTKCFLCGTNCNSSTKNDVFFYQCPACSEYGITEEASRVLKQDKHKYSFIIKERSLKGFGTIIITDGLDGNIEPIPCISLDSIVSLFPKSASEIMNRVLLNLGNSVEYPGDTITINENSKILLFSRDLANMNYFLTQLHELHYVSYSRGYPFGELIITAQGWEKIEKLNSAKGSLNQVFVAMWFDDSMERAYNEGIKKTLDELKYTPIRIKDKEHNDKICDQIISEIRKSKFAVCDFTGHRGGVYFEAGFAMGLGRPVIWTCRKDDIDNAHFDTRQYNHIVWENEKELYEKLKNRIEATIPSF